MQVLINHDSGTKGLIVCHSLLSGIKTSITLPETNISPENSWLEDYFPFGMAYFQGRTVSFREVKRKRRLSSSSCFSASAASVA